MNNDNLKDELKKAKEWAKINLVGKKVYHEGIGKNIIFTQKGIKHAIYAKTYHLKIHLIYHTINLLKSSILYVKKKDKKGRPDIKNIYILKNKFKYNNNEYDIYIIIRETKKGFIYYDHGRIKKP